MSKWYFYLKEKPHEAGPYLILTDDGAGGNTVDADVENFYKSGDRIGSGLPEIEGTAEERLLDSILHRPIIASEDGFYSGAMNDDGEDEYWELKPTFWTYLPEPPEGYEYNK